MNNNEILFIRACKVVDSPKRLNSLYRRLYLATEQDNINHLVGIVADIVDKYFEVSVYKIMADMAPSRYGHDDERTYSERALDVLINIIRFTDIHTLRDNCPGFVSPIRFRRDK